MTSSTLHRDSARPMLSPVNRPPRRRTALDRIVLLLSCANLAVVVLLAVLLCVVSEQWWLSLAMSYLPRILYLVPSLMLIAVSLLLRRRIVWVNLLAALLVLVPIMGFRLPVSGWAATGTGKPLTLVSYNVQSGGGNNEKILAELAQARPDVIILQEATFDPQPLLDYFDEWYYIHTGEYLVAARWPVAIKDACRAQAFGRATAILCQIDHPDEPFLVANVHLTTARHGLAQLRVDSPLSGHGVDVLVARQSLRDQEASATCSCIAEVGFDTPLIVAGDFNMPTSSSLFQQYWGSMTSAFDAGGWGWGYTSPCNTGNLWPGNTPWLRIDHILLSRHWDVQKCWIGTSDGSDHRCIVTRIVRR